jgi:hypothetical protein
VCGVQILLRAAQRSQEEKDRPKVSDAWAGLKQEKLSMVSREYSTTRAPLRVNRIVFRFDKSRLPLAPGFWEDQFGQLRWNRKGWAATRCPFHQSRSGKSFSVHIDGGFFCFGCGVKGGDIVAFVRLRDQCDFPSACKSLGCWDSVSDADPYGIAQKAAERQKKQAEEAKLKRLAHEQRIQLRNQVHTAARIQRDSSDRLIQLLKGAVENYPQEQEHCWSTLALCLDDLRESEAQYMSSMGMEYL